MGTAPDFQGNIRPVKIFLPSSGELAEERKESISIVHSINKLFPELKLEVIKWETDIPGGSFSQRIQDEINPHLENSNIVIALFYSKLGEFTLEEYNLAIKNNMKVFVYFKKGFSAENKASLENYRKVLDFKERLIAENRTLYAEYRHMPELENLIWKQLPLYIKQKFPPVQEIALSGTSATRKLTLLPSKSIELFGRQNALDDIQKLLDTTNRVLLVNGLGGIGKTEVCKAYLWENYHRYSHVGWIDYVSGIKESLVNQIKPEEVVFGEKDTLDERYQKIVHFLNRLDTNSLLVIDNIENTDDPDLDIVRSFPFTVIASSRMDHKGFKRYSLDFLSPNACKQLFYEHYALEKDDGYVEKIVALAGFHTLTIELLAKTAQNSALGARDFWERLQERGFNLNGVIKEKVDTFWHNEKDRRVFFEHMLKVFDMSDLNENEVHNLMNLSILPAIFIDINELSQWLELESKEDINSLLHKGWLRQNGVEVFMHQIIQEVVRYRTAPDAGKCGVIVNSFIVNLHYEPGENPLEKGKYTVFGEAILNCLNEDNSRLAILSNNLSMIYKDMGDMDKALGFQLKSLEISEKVLDKNHPDLATSYNNLSLIYQDIGDIDKALDFQLKSLEIRKKVLDKNHPDLAQSYNNLSTIYYDAGDMDKALEFQLKSLEIRKKVLDKNHPHLAQSYNNLSTIYRAMGDMGKALEFQLKDTEISEKVLVKNHPSLATSYNNLSLIYKDTGNMEKALEFQLKSLEIKEKALDKDHPSLAASYNNLSMIYCDIRGYKKAFEYCEKAIKILKTNFPKGHPNLDVMLGNLEYIKEHSC